MNDKEEKRKRERDNYTFISFGNRIDIQQSL